MVAICLIALAAGNVLLWLSGRGYYYLRDMEAIQRAQHPDVLFVGNSLLESRLDSAALNQGAASGGHSYTPLNSALSASAPHAQGLIAQYAIQLHPQLHTIVIGFYDYQLTEKSDITPADLIGSNAVALDSRIPIRQVAMIDHFNTVQIGEVLLMRAFPMVICRQYIWENAERVRRLMSKLGIPPWSIHLMGRPQSYYVTEPRRFQEDPSHFGSSYEYLFGKAANAKIHIVLVLMPMSPIHRQVYYTRQTWQDYMVKLQRLSQQRGFTFVDASAWMPDATQFQDAIHLTPPAATAFSFRLGAELATAEDAKPGD